MGICPYGNDMYALWEDFIKNGKQEQKTDSSMDSLLASLGQIEGKILDKNGTSLKGINVNITTQEMEDSGKVSPVLLVSDINGSYEMPYLVPGEYILKISGNGDINKQIKCRVNTNQHTLLNITLEDTTTQYPTHPSVTVNNNATSTSIRNVTLNLHCDNATQMMFSERSYIHQCKLAIL